MEYLQDILDRWKNRIWWNIMEYLQDILGRNEGILSSGVYLQLVKESIQKSHSNAPYVDQKGCRKIAEKIPKN